MGSKSRLVEHITGILGYPNQQQRFIDLFCGTGVVGTAAGVLGWKVLSNDVLSAATIISSSKMLSIEDARFTNLGGYNKAIEFLNNLLGLKGYFYREYSPASASATGVPRFYFTESNAKKIDAIRQTIREWFSSGQINEIEKKLLLADLIEAANQVANIAGTYGCFLRQFTESSLRTLRLSTRLLRSESVDWATSTLDAFEVITCPSDVVYIDPPYTKRQYAAYYHIPETIACEDEPIVDGVTGLRPWHSKASIFCYKSKAPSALRELLKRLSAERILLSYSSEGHIEFDKLMEIVEEQGRVAMTKFDNFGRYTPNEKSRHNAHKNPLSEYIIEIRR